MNQGCFCFCVLKSYDIYKILRFIQEGKDLSPILWNNIFETFLNKNFTYRFQVFLQLIQNCFLSFLGK